MDTVYDASHIFPGRVSCPSDAAKIWDEGLKLGHQFAVVAKDAHNREILLTRPERLPFAKFFVFIQSELAGDDLQVINAYNLDMPPPDYLIK